MSGPRPIIYIHHERALGGAPLSLLYLLRQLDSTQYSPSIICLREGPAADLFRENGFPVEIVSGPDLSHTELVWFRWWQWPKLALRLLGSIPLFFSLRSAITKIIHPSILNPQSSKAIYRPIIHLNSSTLLIGALAAKSLGLPLVWHIREPLARGYLGIRRAILRLAIRLLSEHVIAISKNDASQLGSIPSNKLSVIYNFVDFSQFDAARPSGLIRKELCLARDTSLILFLGGSARVKGAEVLLRAIPSMLGGLQSVHLVVAGEISPEFRLQTMEPSLAVFKDRLHILGSRQDIPELLADTSVLIFPSIVPHFARPIIEAAAMAKPVIASDLDGVRELVIRNETGILVPPNDPAALARAVIELIQDPPRAYRLGQQGFVLAREKFDAIQNAKATFAVYKQL